MKFLMMKKWNEKKIAKKKKTSIKVKHTQKSLARNRTEKMKYFYYLAKKNCEKVGAGRAKQDEGKWW